MRRRILFVLIAMIAGTAARSEDMQMREILAKMEAQDARLAAQDALLASQQAKMNDMEAKRLTELGSNGQGAEALISLRKNATVTLGGLVTTGYFYQQYKKNSVYAYDAATKGLPQNNCFNYLLFLGSIVWAF